MSKLPQYRCASTVDMVSAAAKVIWPWLGPVERGQLRAAVEHLDPDARDWMTDQTA